MSQKSVKAKIELKESKGKEGKETLDKNYQKPAAAANNKVKQDLTMKEIDQRLRQEIEKQQWDKTFPGVRTEPEFSETLKSRAISIL